MKMAHDHVSVTRCRLCLENEQEARDAEWKARVDVEHGARLECTRAWVEAKKETERAFQEGFEFARLAEAGRIAAASREGWEMGVRAMARTPLWDDPFADIGPHRDKLIAQGPPK